MPKRTNETPLTVKTKKSGYILSPEQARFAFQYVTNMGNGVEAALVAYDIDRTKKAWYSTANVLASENLQKHTVLEYIRELLDDQGLNDEIVDNETSFLVKQSADKHAKAKGIEIYNKLKGRYEKDNAQKQAVINVFKYDESGSNKPTLSVPATPISTATSESSG